MAINPKRVKYALQRLFSVVGVLLFLGLLLSAIERKQSSDSLDLYIDIPSENKSSFITKQDIRNTIKRRFGHVLNGVPIGNLDVQEVELVLEKDPFVKDADVYIGARNTVHITIEQRQPILRVIDKDGASFYLDEEGVFLPPSANYTARVPVATGHIPTYVEDYQNIEGNMVKGLYELIRFANEDEFLFALIEQIYVTDKHEFEIVPKIGEHRILFGAANDIPMKFENLKIFYKEGIPYEGWQKYKTINLKYKGQVVCKKK